MIFAINILSYHLNLLLNKFKEFKANNDLLVSIL